jgi:hypothetical protein
MSPWMNGVVYVPVTGFERSLLNTTAMAFMDWDSPGGMLHGHQ